MRNSHRFFVYIESSSYFCINIVSQTMSRNLTPRMSSAELRPPCESPGLVFSRWKKFGNRLKVMRGNMK